MADDFDNTDTIDEAEYTAREQEVATLQEKLIDLQHLAASIKSVNGVCKQDIVSLEAHHPEIVTSKYPLGSFTADPSKTNYAGTLAQLTASMEEVSLGLVIFIAWLIAFCIRIIAVLLHNKGVAAQHKELEKRKEEYKHAADQMRKFWQDERKFDDAIKKHFANMTEDNRDVPETFFEMLRKEGHTLSSAKDGYIIIDKLHKFKMQAFMDEHYTVLIEDIISGGELTTAVGECVVGINATIVSVIKATEELLRLTGTNTDGIIPRHDVVFSQIIKVISNVCKKANIEIKVTSVEGLMTAVEALKQLVVKAGETTKASTKYNGEQALGKAYANHKQMSMWIDDGLDRRFKQLKENVDKLERQEKVQSRVPAHLMLDYKNAIRVYGAVLALANSIQSRTERFYKQYTHLQKQNAHDEIAMNKAFAKAAADIDANGLVIDLNKQYTDTWSSDLLGLPHHKAA